MTRSLFASSLRHHSASQPASESVPQIPLVAARKRASDQVRKTCDQQRGVCEGEGLARRDQPSTRVELRYQMPHVIWERVPAPGIIPSSTSAQIGSQFALPGVDSGVLKVFKLFLVVILR